MNNKSIKIEFFTSVLLIIISLTFLLNYGPNIIIKSPEPESTIYDRYPEFNWEGKSEIYRLILTKETNFKEPLLDIVTKENKYKLTQRLDFGKYKLKIIDKDFNEKTIFFTVQSLVAIRLDKEGNFINEGNTEIKSNILATGAAILSVNQLLKSDELNENSYFEQNEE